MLRSFFAIVGCDMRLAYKAGWDVMITLCFFVITAALFSIALQVDYQIMPFVGPVSVLILALLANILNFKHIFEMDHYQGVLNIQLMSPLPLELYVLAKTLSHWCIAGLPITVLTPAVLIFFNIEMDLIWVTTLTLFMVSIYISFLSVFAASLAISTGTTSNRGGLLMSLIVLPLYTPVLIFALSGIMAYAQSYEMTKELTILTALMFFVGLTIPWAAAAALRLR